MFLHEVFSIIQGPTTQDFFLFYLFYFGAISRLWNKEKEVKSYDLFELEWNKVQLRQKKSVVLGFTQSKFKSGSWDE